MVTKKSFAVNAPGRVFLFGEHSDYFGLEVISAALNYSIEFLVKPRDDNIFSFDYVDLQANDVFKITDLITPKHKRDYLRSAFNVLMRNEIKPKCGADIIIKGTIPIAAGLSSSSALSVASIMTIAHLANFNLTKDLLSQLAFEAEVVEFGESGGMMDHLSSVYGGIIHVDFGEEPVVMELNSNIEGLIIGDSLEKKIDTVGDLKMIRTTVESGYYQLKHYINDFNHRTTPLKKIIDYMDILPEPCRTMTITTIKNRDLTRQALAYIKKSSINQEKFGQMIDQHHQLLRDGLKRSTPKLEEMILAAKKAGAFGCKMNGSGGGGTMLAYAPGNEIAVAKAIEKVGGKAYFVTINEGAKLTILRE